MIEPIAGKALNRRRTGSGSGRVVLPEFASFGLVRQDWRGNPGENGSAPRPGGRRAAAAANRGERDTRRMNAQVEKAREEATGRFSTAHRSSRRTRPERFLTTLSRTNAELTQHSSNSRKTTRRNRRKLDQR